MASKYWIKLYHEILHDPKMGRLNDRLWRRFIELCLLAGENDGDGVLPTVGDMAWTLRLEEAELQADLEELSSMGFVELIDEHVTWSVTNFAKRQAPVPGAERVQRYRERKRTEQYYGNDSLPDDETIRHADTDTDTDTESDTDTEGDDLAATAAPAPDPYLEIREAWIELFPDKPKPRENNQTLRSKAKTRWKSDHFQEHWRAAMTRASNSDFCNSGGWFDLGWFLKNADNYEKCLNGNYDNGKARASPGSLPIGPTGKPEPKGWAAARAVLAREEAKRGNVG